MTDIAKIQLATCGASDLGFDVEAGEMVSVAVVEASNLVRDIIEYLRNIFGGRMGKYEALFDRVLTRGQQKFREELAARGYDGAICVRYAHPDVIAGGAELIIYGTGYRRR
ncbi:MAG: YbjQ family protein [Neomegalonema sp.]|nr:YbjQ family protein [Neomegalonema sp.]